MTGTKQSMNVLVLSNSASPGYLECYTNTLPYLEHFGVPYNLLDVNHTPLPANLGDYALILVAHRQIDPYHTCLGPASLQRFWGAIESGTGLVSFDPRLSFPWSGKAQWQDAGFEEKVEFRKPHFITQQHGIGDELKLVGKLRLPRTEVWDGEILVTVGDYPLVTVSTLGVGRLVAWTTGAWMKSNILGPLGGLDDVLWRSMVWAARKPFALRGLPPLVTMRVDDVVAYGEQWGQSPLYWVHVANQYGLKPWLGLFIYNLTELAINELRDLIEDGKATAFPHAFGRPPRSRKDEWHYYPQALPMRASEYDEFIFYDHHHKRPWSMVEAERGIKAADEWYAAHSPLPMSHYAVAHWYEMGSNLVEHVQRRWGADFIAKVQDFDAPLTDRVPWWKGGPFRKYELPGTCFPFSGKLGNRPVYYADFMNCLGYQFFNCVTEIRDDAGYEWAPDNDVTATIGRGVRQIRRALDSMALPVLFTHETDYIYKIRPENWEKIIHGISTAIASDDPIYVTLDEGIRYIRATRTAHFESCCYDIQTRQVQACFTGNADVPLSIQLFLETEGNILPKRVKIPEFNNRLEIDLPQ